MMMLLSENLPGLGSKRIRIQILLHPRSEFLKSYRRRRFRFDSSETQATLEYKGEKQTYEVFFMEFEDFAGSYVYPIPPTSSLKLCKFALIFEMAGR